MTEIKTYYMGRRWDAPMADDAVLVDLTGQSCALCRELIDTDDDAMVLGGIFHTECILRSGMGDVAHLEQRCLCVGGTEHDEQGTYREQSARVVDWLIEHRRGGWADA